MQKFSIIEAFKLGIRCRPEASTYWYHPHGGFMYSASEVLRSWDVHKIDYIKLLVKQQVEDKRILKALNKELRGRSKWYSSDYKPRPALDVCKDISKYSVIIRDRASSIKEVQSEIEAYRKDKSK